MTKKNKYSFICHLCHHEFQRKIHLDTHLEKNACKKHKYHCKYCHKGFTTDNSMYRHMKHTCKVKKDLDSKKDKILERLIKLEDDNKLIKQENNKLKKEIKKIKKSKLSTTIKKITNNNNNKINNGTINKGTINNNIVLIGYGKEDLAKIDKKDILKSLKKGFYSTIQLTEAVHFNPKYPEYHNVYISNIKDKYAMMYDGKEWTLTRKAELIERLYENKRDYIEDNMDEFIESLSQSQTRALERWLKTDDNHNKIKEIKDKIKLLLYNKRDIIINKNNV